MFRSVNNNMNYTRALPVAAGQGGSIGKLAMVERSTIVGSSIGVRDVSFNT